MLLHTQCGGLGPWQAAFSERFGAACWFDADFVVDLVVLQAATEWSARGIPLVLVSNQEPRRARFIKEHLGGLLPFRGTAFSSDLGLTKKDLDSWERAEPRLDVVGRARRSSSLTTHWPTSRWPTVMAGTCIHFNPAQDWRRQAGHSHRWLGVTAVQPFAQPTGWALSLRRESTTRARDPQGTIASR